MEAAGRGTGRFSRREWLAGVTAAFFVSRSVTDASAEIAAIERRLGGRLGVAVLDTASGRRIEHRANERFAMCSTFKFLASAAMLARIDAKQERLDRVVHYTNKDLLEYAPIAKEHVAAGMTIEALMAAAVSYSDNTAANLLLAALGGPQAVTKYARILGDAVTRLDRNEPALNEVPAGEIRDTTSPASMLKNMQTLLLGATALSEPSRQLLTTWMVGNTTGNERLRAGLPKSWRVGDKTGTGPHAATNDIGIAWPPSRAPVLIAAYFWGSRAVQSELNAALADVARLAAP
ncbi:MAG TPA: class A beta-lactamase [Vicinamibacterales bacterium]|nr:class A beta-lactamase [Vicinamibacterales bacterium]